MQVSVWPRGLSRTRRTGPLGIEWGGEYNPVDPVHSTRLGKLLSVKFSTRYEQGFGGHDLAEWVIRPHASYIGGLFRPGDPVRVTHGGGIPWEGEFSEAAPNADGTVTFKARGYAYNLFDYDSIHFESVEDGPDVYYPTNKLGTTTLIPEQDSYDGWLYATEVLGMPISQVVGTFPSTAWGDSEVAQKPVKVGTVLTGLLLSQNKRWAVWGRTLVCAADPTDAVLTFDAPEGLIGVADTDYATHVGVWYVASAPDDYAMAWAIDAEGIARFDVRTEVVDYRGAGLMTGAAAGDLAQALLDQVKGRFVLSGSISITRDSGLKHPDGGPAVLSMVRAGIGMNLSGVRTSQGNLLPDGDFSIIGKTDYEWTAPEALGAAAAESLTITPMGAVPRNLGEVLKGVPPDAGEQLSGAA